MEFDLADIYFNELKNDKDFIRLQELNKIIKEKYSLLIVAFKTQESYYNEAVEKNYGEKVILDLRKKLQEKKTELYSKEEVKEYKKLELKINKKINDDFNELKSSISNKFSINETINF